MGYEHDDRNNGHGRGHGKGHDWDEGHGNPPGKGHGHHEAPRVGSVQIYRDGDTTVLVVDGEEARIPGIRANVNLECDGRVSVSLSATLNADKAEVGGVIGS